MVTTFYPPYHFGGDAMYVYRLSEALAQRGHQVDIVHSVDAFRLQHPEDPEIAFDHHPGTRRIPLESKRPLLAALAAHQLGRPALYGRRLRRVLERGRYDVIHHHNASLMGAPGVLATGRSIKLYTANEYWLICPTHVLFAFDREACTERRCLACTIHSRRPPQLWRYTGALRRQLRHVDRLLILSQFALAQHRAQGVERPMTHLPYFIPEATSVAPADGPAPPEKPFFLYVGRLEKLKGVQDLVELFRSYREADLLIVGDGGYAPTLRASAAGLDNVRFVGTLHPASVGLFYDKAIAVLVPSLCYETFGWPIAEALNQGTPVVARRIGALAENVEESGGGFAFDTLEECRLAMERLRTEPGLRERLGRDGRAVVRKV